MKRKLYLKKILLSIRIEDHEYPLFVLNVLEKLKAGVVNNMIQIELIKSLDLSIKKDEIILTEAQAVQENQFYCLH